MFHQGLSNYQTTGQGTGYSLGSGQVPLQLGNLPNSFTGVPGFQQLPGTNINNMSFTSGSFPPHQGLTNDTSSYGGGWQGSRPGSMTTASIMSPPVTVPLSTGYLHNMAPDSRATGMTFPDGQTAGSASNGWLLSPTGTSNISSPPPRTNSLSPSQQNSLSPTQNRLASSSFSANTFQGNPLGPSGHLSSQHSVANHSSQQNPSTGPTASSLTPMHQLALFQQQQQTSANGTASADVSRAGSMTNATNTSGQQLLMQHQQTLQLLQQQVAARTASSTAVSPQGSPSTSAAAGGSPAQAAGMRVLLVTRDAAVQDAVTLAVAQLPMKLTLAPVQAPLTIAALKQALPWDVALVQVDLLAVDELLSAYIKSMGPCLVALGGQPGAVEADDHLAVGTSGDGRLEVRREDLAVIMLKQGGTAAIPMAAASQPSPPSIPTSPGPVSPVSPSFVGIPPVASSTEAKREALAAAMAKLDLVQRAYSAPGTVGGGRGPSPLQPSPHSPRSISMTAGSQYAAPKPQDPQATVRDLLAEVRGLQSKLGERRKSQEKQKVPSTSEIEVAASPRSPSSNMPISPRTLSHTQPGISFPTLEEPSQAGSSSQAADTGRKSREDIPLAPSPLRVASNAATPRNSAVEVAGEAAKQADNITLQTKPRTTSPVACRSKSGNSVSRQITIVQAIPDPTTPPNEGSEVSERVSSSSADETPSPAAADQYTRKPSRSSHGDQEPKRTSGLSSARTSKHTLDLPQEDTRSYGEAPRQSGKVPQEQGRSSRSEVPHTKAPQEQGRSSHSEVVPQGQQGRHSRSDVPQEQGRHSRSELPQEPRRHSRGELPQELRRQSRGELPQEPRRQSRGGIPKEPRRRSRGEVAQQEEAQSTDTYYEPDEQLKHDRHPPRRGVSEVALISKPSAIFVGSHTISITAEDVFK